MASSPILFGVNKAILLNGGPAGGPTAFPAMYNSLHVSGVPFGYRDYRVGSILSFPTSWNDGFSDLPARSSFPDIFYVLSWKVNIDDTIAGNSDAAIKTFALSCEAYWQANSTAKNPQPLIVSLWHEADSNSPGVGGNPTSAQILGLHAHVYPIFKRWAPDVMYGQIMVPDANRTTALGRQFISCPATISNGSVLDYYSFDGYSHSSSSNPTASAIFDGAFAAVQALAGANAVLGITEANTYCNTSSGNGDASFEVTWWTQCWALAQQFNCLMFMPFFQTKASNAIPWNPTNDPNAAALAELQSIAANSGGGGGGGGPQTVKANAAPAGKGTLSAQASVTAPSSLTGNIWATPSSTVTIDGAAVPCPLAVSVGEPWRVLFDISPTSNQTTAQYNSFFAACQAAGLVMDVSIWHNSTDTFTASQYIAIFQQYAPVIKAHGFRTVFSMASTEIAAGDLSSYYPGDSYVDVVADEFYMAGFNNGDQLKTASDFADAHGKIFSISEFGVSSGDVSSGATGESSPLVGAFVSTTGFASQAAAITAWTTVTGRSLDARREYFSAGQFPASITADFQADLAAGRKVCLTLKPAYNPVSATDRASISTFLSSCSAAGLEMDICLWHEPFYAGLTAAQYIAMVKYYGPTIRSFYPLVFVTANFTVNNNNENSFYPGDDFIDKVATDFYCHDYIIPLRLDLAASVANNAVPPKPFGLWEFNSCTTQQPGKGAPQTQAQADAYFAYVQSYFSTRDSSGLPNADRLLFNSDGPDGPGDTTTQITSAGDYRVPLYQSIYDANASATSDSSGEAYLTYIYDFLLSRIITPGTLTGDVLYYNEVATTGTDPGDFTLQSQSWEVPYYQQIYDLLANSSVLTAASQLSARGVISGRARLTGAARLTGTGAGHANGAAHLAGAGRLSSASVIPFQHPAILQARGSVTAVGSQQHPSGTALQGNGIMTAQGVSALSNVVVAFIVLTGRGTIATRVKWTAPAAAQGAATLGSAARLRSPSHLAAQGALAAASGQLPRAQLAAAGSLAVIGAAQAPSSVQGAGALSAAVTQGVQAQAAVAGIIQARATIGASCHMAGAATLGARVRQRSGAHLAGSSVLHATIRNPGKAKVAGAGHLTPHFKIIIVRQFLDPDGGGRLTAIGTVIDNGPPEPAFTMAQYQVTRAPLIPDPPGHDQPLDPQLTGRALT